MHRRLIAGILLLAFAWQGPALAYSASLAASATHGSGSTRCGGDLLPMTDACAACCSHGSGSCATICTLPLGAAIPSTVTPISLGIAQTSSPNATTPMVVEDHPARLLRPPIG